ncbi:hypothetical protein SUGI_0861430 [Cryptomeria japonica]|nr:hypothetical protein SUGI_0861430 [Cryptomeria japonica]
MLSKTAPSPYRDRTAEFHNVVGRLRKSSSYNPSFSLENGTLNNPTGLHGVSLQSEFNKRASRIGLGIHQTSQMLSRLAQCKSELFTCVLSSLVIH